MQQVQNVFHKVQDSVQRVWTFKGSLRRLKGFLEKFVGVPEELQEDHWKLRCRLTFTWVPVRPVRPVRPVVLPACYLQDVVQQGDSGLVGFRFCQFEQSADLKTLGVPRVSPLMTSQNKWHHIRSNKTVDDVINCQMTSNISRNKQAQTSTTWHHQHGTTPTSYFQKADSVRSVGACEGLDLI